MKRNTKDTEIIRIDDNTGKTLFWMLLLGGIAAIVAGMLSDSFLTTALGFYAATAGPVGGAAAYGKESKRGWRFAMLTVLTILTGTMIFIAIGKDPASKNIIFLSTFAALAAVEVIKKKTDPKRKS